MGLFSSLLSRCPASISNRQRRWCVFWQCKQGVILINVLLVVQFAHNPEDIQKDVYNITVQ